MKKNKFILFFLFLAAISFGQKQNVDSTSNVKLNAKKQIEKYRARVIKDESMASLAILYSEDPGSAGEGGIYYNVARGVMDPKFESVAFSLKQGQISQVFETAYGFHFIQLVKIHGKLLDLRHILIIPK
ncbi:MAG: peptidylprolyl isomerase [Bacteroidota bacterium]|nr:peptidylprolyl isomerase [Bacteroidota bacterium]